MTKPDLDLLVIGGGISGLTVAREARRLRPKWKVRVLESDPRPGGTMRSDRVEGCICEWGPNGFLTNVPYTADFSRELGLENRLLPAGDAAQNRYLWVRGKLRPVPMTPPAFLKSNLLSVRGRLRVLLEPVAS
jgi:oxygen-dependent protoporphyrinogen oxidase